MTLKRFGALFLISIFTFGAFAQVSPWRFTYEGFLEENGKAVSDSKILRFQILGKVGAQSCLLYDEKQTIDVDGGHFSVHVGEGARQSGSDPGYSLKEVYGQPSTFTNLKDDTGVACATYDGSAARRYLRVYVGTELLGDLELTRAPMATLAEEASSVGGKTIQDLLQVNVAAGLTQTNLETLMQSFAAGTVNGAQLADGSVPLSKLASGSCLVGQSPKLTGTGWVCDDTNALTIGTTAGTAAAGNDPRFGNATKIAGADISIPSLAQNQILRYDGSRWVNSNDSDFLSALACVDGKVVKRVSGTWACSDDEMNPGTLTGVAGAGPYVAIDNSVPGVPAVSVNVGIASGTLAAGNDARFGDATKINGTNVQTVGSLSSGQVLRYDGSKWYNASDSDALASLSCTDGKVVKRVNGVWDCSDDATNPGTVTGLSSANSYLAITDATTAPVLEVKVGQVAGTVAAGNDARFENAKKLDGKNLAVAAAGNGQFLKYNGSEWIPSNVSDSLANLSCADGEVVKRSGTQWQCGTDAISGAVSGDAAALTSGTVDIARLPVVSIAKGGTGATTAADAFAALSPLLHKGELIGHTGSANVIVPAAASDLYVLRSNSTTSSGLEWALPVATDLASMATTGIVQRNGAGNFSQAFVNAPLTYTLGGGLGISVGQSSGTVAAGNDSRFGNTAKIQNVFVDPTTPSAGQVLKFDGTNWIASPDSTGGAPSGAASGDLTGTYPAPTLRSIQGQLVAAASPTGGQFLKYSGGQWAPANVGFADMKKSNGLSQLPVSNCAANESLAWSSVSDQFSCALIGSLDASKITSGTIDSNRLPTVPLDKGGTGSSTGSISSTSALTFSTSAGGGLSLNASTGNIQLTPVTNGQVSILSSLRVANSANTVSFTLKPGGSGSPVWTMPAGDGTPGQVMSTDGSGNLQFSTVNGLSLMGAGTLLANLSGSTALPSAATPSALIDSMVGSGNAVQGAILYRTTTGWVALAPGTSGHFLKSQGPGASPLWAGVTGLDINAATTGTLPLSRGGTGSTDGSISTGTALSFSSSGAALSLSGAGGLTLSAGSNAVNVGPKLGVGTSSPRGALEVANGAIVSRPATTPGGTTIDFSYGNVLNTASSCQTFNLHNLKDGGSYIFIVKGATSATCSFNVFSDAGLTALTKHMPIQHGATIASKHTLYNFLVSGGDVYISWIPGY